MLGDVILAVWLTSQSECVSGLNPVVCSNKNFIGLPRGCVGHQQFKHLFLPEAASPMASTETQRDIVSLIQQSYNDTDQHSSKKNVFKVENTD